jgi:hypothetical protein
MSPWLDHAETLARTARLQLFFVGGAPRSGTTWLQQMLDCHPQISCKGEGLFWKNLAIPLDAAMVERGRAIRDKNAALFSHTGGYQAPPAEHTDMLLATAILLALRDQSAAKPCRAVGEKTPENVFFFSRLKRLFPQAKLIAIARDPRDVLTSAWHFFKPDAAAREAAGDPQHAAKAEFVRAALPSIAEGTRSILAHAERYRDDCRIVTYESLHALPAQTLADIFRFLAVDDAAELAATCVAQTAFPPPRAEPAEPSTPRPAFLRKGTVGDWTTTLTPEMNDMILRQLGWVYPRFGWVP